jgi:hypothetical protein
MNRKQVVGTKWITIFSLALVGMAVSGCSMNSSTGSSGTTSSASEDSSSALAISPSSVTLTENEGYTFTASGGSGSGYTYAVVSGYTDCGSIESSTGYFVSASDWTGTGYVSVTDSDGNVSYSEITISTTSSSSVVSISPSSITLDEGSTYYFTASGGTGSYTYTIVSGSGTIGSSTGLFTAPTALSGVTYVEVTDTDGNTAEATITIEATSSSSSTNTTYITSTYSALAAENSGCTSGGWSDYCASAVNRYCQANGYVSGYGPVEIPGSGGVVFACTGSKSSLITTSYTELQDVDSKCATNGWNDYCASAVNRYCQADGYTAGYGPVEIPGNGNVQVVCLNGDAEDISVSYSTLTAENSGCTNGGWDVACESAASRYCRSAGYVSGFGPVEIPGNATANIVCTD